MQFTTRKRRQAPAVIIVSLIDVLIVVLIFLIVTTTYKQQPSVKLALPDSKRTQSGSTEDALIVTIPKQGPLYFKTEPVTLEKLQAKLVQAVRQNPQATLSIRADTDAPFGQIVRVMDAAKEANVKTVSAFTKAPGK